MSKSRELLVGLLGILVIWFISRGIVIGNLKILEYRNNAIDYSSFTWAGPVVKLKSLSVKTVEISGYAYHPQTIVMSCLDGQSSSHKIKPGYFSINHICASTCGGMDFTIKSDYSFIPATQRGSNDTRVLSYQIGLVEINGKPIPLPDFVKEADGVYGVRQQFSRITANQVLSSTWDSMWYMRIVMQGYSFDGNRLVQQNVSWPFLYPYAAKFLGVVLKVSAADALILTNAFASLIALFGLFLLGRMLGLGVGMAILSPLWLAFNPFAFFVYGGFSESLFILLLIAWLILTLHKQWLLSAFMIAALTATRFVGGVVVFPLIAYWLLWNGRNCGARRSVMTILGLGSIAALGILADILIKWHVTGAPFATFLVHKAWPLTPLNVAKNVFYVDKIYSGEYLPVIIAGFAVILLGLWVCVRLFREHAYPPATVVVSGLLVVLAAWIINPELHSLGRYSLPLAVTVPGLLSRQSSQRWVSIAISILTVIGGGFMGLITTRLYYALPPY